MHACVAGEKALQAILETLLNREVDGSTASDFNASAAGTVSDLALQMRYPRGPPARVSLLHDV